MEIGVLEVEPSCLLSPSPLHVGGVAEVKVIPMIDISVWASHARWGGIPERNYMTDTMWFTTYNKWGGNNSTDRKCYRSTFISA